ncbi:MAG TPA: hypothetical protein VMY35_07365 [Phycisphaerae bacterium]|nr:hypothetical protein [Phycisphaerae bacterium]
MITPEVRRRRAVREAILRLLNAAYAGSPDVGVPFEQIAEGFSPSRVRYTAREIEAALLDLADDNLIVQENASWGDPPMEKLYKVTGPGRDFVLARFPWGRVDEYTGDQNLPGISG